MIPAIEFISSTAITDNIRTIGCTGGGAHKYAKQFEEFLDITIQHTDELGSLLKGMDFALTNVSGECYTYRYADDNSNESSSGKSPSVNRWKRDVKEYTSRVTLPMHTFTSKEIFPYLVVNIGSGVSIIKVYMYYLFRIYTHFYHPYIPYIYTYILGNCSRSLRTRQWQQSRRWHILGSLSSSHQLCKL